MTSVKGEAIQESDPLRLDRCPDCGYSLCGLPEQGLCPECGFEYNDEMIVLYGWGTGNRATIFNRSWKSVIIGMLIPYPCMLMQMLPTVFARGWRWQNCLLLAGMLAFDVVLLYGRWRAGADTGKRAQLRLCPQGYAQRTGFGRVRLRPWRRQMQISMTSANKQRYKIRRPVFFAVRLSRLIDMEFDSDPTTAARIHKQINQWCAASGR